MLLNSHISIRLLLPVRCLLTAVVVMASMCAFAQVNHSKELTLKTNAIGWAMAVSNLSLEYRFAPRVAVELPVYYSGWDYFSSDLKFRGFAMQPGVRCYIDNNMHFAVGMHLGFAYYNVAFGGDYRYQSHREKCPMGGGGIDLSYCKKFGNAHQWGFECSIGFGAYLNEYDRYQMPPYDCDPTDLSHYVNGICINTLPTKFRKAFLGCDRLALSLTYTFNLKTL